MESHRVQAIHAIHLQNCPEGDSKRYFMAFSVAMCTLISPVLVKRYSRYAADLLKFFVERGRELYGHHFLVYNTHSMLHIVEDAVSFNGLDNCSAFKFKNHLKTLKRMVRSGRCPLSQVECRIEEQRLQPIKMSRQNTNLKNFILHNQDCCEVIEEKDGSHLYQHPEPHFLEPCDSTLYCLSLKTLTQC